MSSATTIHDKRYAELARLARRQNWTVEFNGAGHLTWTPPDGSRPVNTASSPSDYRSYANDEAKLKRAGLITNKAALRRIKGQNRRPTQPDITTQEEPTVGTSMGANLPFYCRKGCEGSFKFKEDRDRHEREGCPRAAGLQVPEPEPTPEPKGKRKLTITFVPCPAGCGKEVARNRVGPHLRAHHPDFDADAPVPSGPMLDRLVATVFPVGPPLEPTTLVALAEWVEATKAFLDAIGDAA